VRTNQELFAGADAKLLPDFLQSQSRTATVARGAPGEVLALFHAGIASFNPRASTTEIGQSMSLLVPARGNPGDVKRMLANEAHRLARQRERIDRIDRNLEILKSAVSPAMRLADKPEPARVA
jgi:hypothetical protein